MIVYYLSGNVMKNGLSNLDLNINIIQQGVLASRQLNFSRPAHNYSLRVRTGKREYNLRSFQGLSRPYIHQEIQ